MITRCPSCLTAFRVTDAQLAARGGQVRCGACSHVFDANAHLLPGDALPVEPVHIEQPAEPSEPIGSELPPRDSELPPVEWPVIESLEPAPIAADTSVPVVAEPPAPEPSPQPLAAAAAAPAVPDDFGFGPQPEPRGRRLLWVGGSAALAVVFIAQALFHFRGDLALRFPDAKPLLAEACATLGCTIPLPRRSDLMTIDASDLQADGTNPDVMVLTATLRNRAPFAQAHPALELTLTDAQELLVARRVLFAPDYLGAAPDPETGFASGAERPIRVPLQLAGIKATGYRLYLFYP